MRPSIALSLTLSLGLLAPAQALAGPGEVSFTPAGFKLSIMKISIAKQTRDGDAVLYRCSGATEADCLVDVMDQTQLDAVATSAGKAEIPVGTYDRVALSLCTPGKTGGATGQAFLKGQFEVGGVTYFTDGDTASIGGLKTTGSADFTAVGNWTCNDRIVDLATPLEVKEGTAADLSIVFDGVFIASSSPATSSGQGGCRAEQGQRGFCVAYPSILSYVGPGAVSVRRFLVAHHASDAAAIDDSKANGYVVAALTDSSRPIIAFTRPYSSETSAPISQAIVEDPVFGGPGYLAETDVDSFVVNTDGSIAFDVGGSDALDAVRFRSFRLEDHKGIITTGRGTMWQYHARPVLP